MKGDFTRSSFKQDKHYSGVRMQQGRMQLDADWNEQLDIKAHRDRTTHRDVIGYCGGPKGKDENSSDLAGFKITALGANLNISKGRYYANGILCENEADVLLTEQENLPDFNLLSIITEDSSVYLAYLDVWERHITALEDNEIREVALGGPDTATRTKVIWQVKLEPVTSGDCSAFGPDWMPAGTAGTGKLAARAEPSSGDEGPCIVPSRAGYRRLENQLYRLEIHQGGGIGTASFKWSRENGSVVIRWEDQDGDNLTVSSPSRDHILGFSAGDWVELIDDTREFLGRPGVLVCLGKVDGQVFTIDPATIQDPDDPGATSVDRNQFPHNPKIRRWESNGAESVTIPFTNDGWIELEDGVEIKFQSGDFQPGDYWLIPARTALGDVLWPVDDVTGEAEFQLRHGKEHSFCPLALVTWQPVDEETFASEIIEDCRPIFPSLTNICAEDVCFDNDSCKLVDAETVQDALDRLCAANDLRHHNKHLHGWGIVCGLQVVCGPDEDNKPRKNVTVRRGYAIDCEGDDILIEQNEVADILEKIRELDQEDPDTPVLNEDGNGEVCLTLGLDEQRRVQVGLERYEPSKDNLQSMLDGTLLMDFYNDCIKNLVDVVQDELTPDPEEKRVLVGPTQRRLMALLNLFIQVYNSANGRYVFLSRREHQILHSFYDKLRTLLQSKTFCAMYQGADFPEYPFPETELSTIFGKGFHSRLRIHPRGDAAYTCAGTDNKIHVYHLKKEEMAEVLEMPAGEGAEVQDIAFSPDGKELYAIAMLRGTDTVFGVADIARGKHKWRKVAVLCDIRLTTLVVPAKDTGRLYAIGRSAGLYFIEPERILEETKPRPDPKFAFNAVGHIVLDERKGFAYATANSGENSSDTYDQVVALNVGSPPEGDNAEPNKTEPLRLQSGEALHGEDDIALCDALETNAARLYVITNPRSESDKKHLLAFDTGKLSAPVSILDVEDTAIRMAYHAKSRRLLLTLEDGYRLQVIDSGNSETTVQRHPVQISPIAVTTESRADRIYVLNYISNTISVIPSNELSNTEEFLDELKAYRNDVLTAFIRLLGGLLQYLKDCFCDHLVVKCPTCDEEDKLYLACAEIRANQIHKVCNFSKRRYVKSFPTVGYWLSLIPIVPLLKKAVEKTCCAVMPDLFDNLIAKYIESEGPGASDIGKRVKSKQVREGIQLTKRTDFKGEFRAQKKTLNVYGKLAFDSAANHIESSSLQKPGVRKSLLLGSQVDDARNHLEENGVIVDKVETYDRSMGAKNLLAFGKTPLRLSRGSKVTLYERDGKVLFYALSEEPGEIDVSEEVKEEIGALRDQLGQIKSDYKRLRTDREAEEARLTELETRKDTVVEGLETLREHLRELSSLHRDLSLEVARDRPIKAVSGVTKEIDTYLRELDIRTVGELAAAKASDLTKRGSPITREQASILIRRAKERIKLR
jgi:DNA-binding beta-propeller fold protein YncE/phage FluMu protein Com